jgi:preprotein translocase subunit SecY
MRDKLIRFLLILIWPFVTVVVVYIILVVMICIWFTLPWTDTALRITETSVAKKLFKLSGIDAFF